MSPAYIASNESRTGGRRVPQTVLMSDPHVEALHYRFRSLNDNDTFDRAVPLSGALGDFDYVLESATLIARPRSHFGDRTGARDALEPYLRSWERGAFLSRSNHRITFEYDHADIVDRQPDAGGVTVYPETARLQAIAFAPTIKRDNGRYPEPDSSFITTPLTDRLAERLRRVRDGEELVSAAAYYVLTALELEYGGAANPGQKRRAAAAAALSVEVEILNTMGRLTASEDPDVGRKADGGNPTSLTAGDQWWLQEAVGLLVRRTGEIAAGTTPRTQSMSDLPKL